MSENYETALPEPFDPAMQEGNILVPVGVYTAQITDACVAQPKSGDGHYIGLTWQIMEGEHEGRYVWQNITFLHSNTQAVLIGRKQFKDLCVATGISEQVDDVAVFKYVPCRIRVGIQQDKQGVYPDQNKVSRVLPLTDQAPAEKKTAGQPAATAKPAAAKPAAATKSDGDGTTPPWRKPATKPSVSDEINDKNPY